MKICAKVQAVTAVHRHTARVAITVLFAALLSTVPFHTAFAQTAPALGRAANFAVLGGTAVSLTDSTIIGNAGSPVAVTIVRGTVVGTAYAAGDLIVIGAYNDFLNVYSAVVDMGLYPCTGSLNTAYTDATLTLAPGVYCNDAAVTFTRTVLTLDAQNDPNAVWIFKIGTLGTGALTGTSLSVVMSGGGQPCNVYWWTAQAATMTTSNFKGDLLAGVAATFTGGSVIGRTMTQAGLTMTGTDVFGCNSLVPPPPGYADYDKDHDKKDHDKDNDKDHDKKDRNKDHDKDHGDRK
jgi:hypothetical protein